ncbi:maleylpyruvate isomerase family mycothiol-dependent enzyme [Glycomyces salinus]|uniref:maleylpyruvate isomerase family mycothiol-dependent enzyme n=1 Tax=Glycomyces salinus TaxID=980294 RepID=UPI0018EA8DFA|nr:maleylpyruvate isomerase family mycothiol-dependent enzyme [Glycomyces salinus]
MVSFPELVALRAESARLGAVMAGLDDRDWARPTRCAPWDAAALAAHVTIALDRLGPMLAASPPPEATVDAAGYYTRDRRFSPEVDAARVDQAAEAARAGGPAVADRFARTWQATVEACAQAGPDRLVTTRHGDPMTLADFTLTRVVEVAVHGIDLADATGRPRWTTVPAAAAVAGFLLGGPGRLEALGWDPVVAIAKAAGRDEATGAERERLAAVGAAPLAFG